MSMSMFHVPCSMSLLHSLCIPHATPSCSCAASPGWYIVHRAVQVFRLPKPHRGWAQRSAGTAIVICQEGADRQFGRRSDSRLSTIEIIYTSVIQPSRPHFHARIGSSCFGQLVAACTRRNSREHQRGCRGRDVPRGDCCDRHRGLIARSGVQGFVRLASHSGICVSNRAAPPPVIERQLTRVEIRKKKFVDALVGQTARARCVRRFIVAAEACASWPVRAGGRPGVNEPHELAHETDRTHRVGARALGS